MSAATAAGPLVSATVSPAGGVVLGFVAMMVTTNSVMSFNVPITRAAAWVAIALYGAAVALASGAPLLGLAAVAPMVGLLPTEFAVRHFDRVPLFVVGALLACALLLALAWPVGLWGLAVLPTALFTLVIGGMTIKGARQNLGAGARIKVKVGEPMPPLALPFRSGEGSFDLAEARGRHVLLVLVRGDWCAACHVMMRVINREAEALARHGVQVLIVTPEAEGVDEEFATHIALDSRMLFDRDAQTATRLGLIDSAPQRDGHDVPLPIAILVDPEGTIRDITRPDDVTVYANERKLEAVLGAAAVAG